jgi:hypothetical protein
MTPDEIRAYVKATPLPTGWSIEPQVTRQYRFRNEWRLVLVRDNLPVTTFAHIYDVRGVMPRIVAFIDGYVA